MQRSPDSLSFSSTVGEVLPTDERKIPINVFLDCSVMSIQTYVVGTPGKNHVDASIDTKTNVIMGKLTLLVSSADNLCKQFGTKPSQTNVWPDLGPNCLTLMVFLK